MPGGGATGISRKLPEQERKRLKEILKRIVPSEAGVIIRTAAEGIEEAELEQDVRRLAAQWEVIERTGARRPRAAAARARDGKGSGSKAPTLVHEEPDLLIRVVRDMFNEDFSSLVISGEQAWETLEGYISHVAPELVPRLSRHTGPEDVFSAYRIDEQLVKALDRKVWLPSGGTLVIDRTEAMTVVDVNTGKFTGSGGNLEETVTRNNLEAAEEVVRQLRLRDIGGMIVIDFIDMVLESNRDLVLRRLTECLGRDRTRHQVAEVTSLGLVQMTRKRVGAGPARRVLHALRALQGPRRDRPHRPGDRRARAPSRAERSSVVSLGLGVERRPGRGAGGLVRRHAGRRATGPAPGRTARGRAPGADAAGVVAARRPRAAPDDGGLLHRGRGRPTAERPCPLRPSSPRAVARRAEDAEEPEVELEAEQAGEHRDAGGRGEAGAADEAWRGRGGAGRGGRRAGPRRDRAADEPVAGAQVAEEPEVELEADAAQESAGTRRPPTGRRRRESRTPAAAATPDEPVTPGEPVTPDEPVAPVAASQQPVAAPGGRAGRRTPDPEPTDSAPDRPPPATTRVRRTGGPPPPSGRLPARRPAGRRRGPLERVGHEPPVPDPSDPAGIVVRSSAGVHDLRVR